MAEEKPTGEENPFDFDFSFDFDFDDSEPEPEKEQKPKEPEQAPPERSVKVSHRYGNRHISRKAKSEQALMNAMDWYFEPGDCYHCFSFGDVDSMTYFKHVLRQQPVLYLALSTWCMAGEDVDDLRKWHRRGMLGRVDFFVGEIFPGSYPEVYTSVCSFAKECQGRVVVFRNHAKVMAVVGEKFDVLIESSANVNTNPRSENTVLTCDSSLVADYVDLFNGIIPFNKDFRDRPGYQIPKRPWQEEKHDQDGAGSGDSEDQAGDTDSRTDPRPRPAETAETDAEPGTPV